MEVGSPSAFSPTEHIRKSTLGSSIRALSSRCHQCCTQPKENGRNLVVCIDGTSNQMGDHNSNVVKLFAKIDLKSRQREQLVYYSSGIGTDKDPSSVLTRIGRAISDKFDMAIAWNVEEIIKETYSWLARMYEEGDQIYLFGFSRGAYQARVLASMIHEIGLIKRPTEKQITRAYYYYEAIRSGSKEAKHIANIFKSALPRWDIKVHFVGVWDTVSSVGLIRHSNFLSASASAVHACHFRHALALDELRVKFIPEYLHDMNFQANESSDVRSEYIGTSSDEHVTSTTSERHQSTVSDNGIELSGGKKNKTSIKEVWFAGSHSDVGGVDRSGKPNHAGNVSLLWMRREAAACGLVLLSTGLVWVPDDIDLGISDSMTPIWRLIEYMPITHQVSFSGSGDNARRPHRLQPRRIIPGQKVHASVLYANAYRPQALFGEGFEIPIVHPGLEAELDSQLWDDSLFDDSAAEELVTYLSARQGVAPIYLDRLLFMLRFKEGKQCVRNVRNWQNQFLNLIHNRNCAPLVRLVAIVAYYEASCEPDAHAKSPAPPRVKLSNETFDEAKRSLSIILAAHKHRDGPRVVALLRPLTRHQVLRERILTEDVLETLMNLLDVVIGTTGGNFGQAMDGLTCLLKCEDTRGTIIKKLGTNLPNTNVSRLSRILKIQDPGPLTAALRMVLTLAGIPEARPACLLVRPRLKELAQKNRHLAGLLSVDILLALYHPGEPGYLNIRNTNVRGNLFGVLNRLSPDGCNPTDGDGGVVDPGQAVLRRIFGVDAEGLSLMQERLIGELKRAIQNGSVRERVPATMTVLNLCKTDSIRTFLRDIGLLSVFVSQLRHKDKALLAAYALVICLKFDDMKELIISEEPLPRNIVGMLRFDYFDDAIGLVEGFQIFRDLMQHADLRKKINSYDITDVLNKKLVKGKPKETRTSLICLDIFLSFDKNGPWTKGLVEKSLEHLKKPDWKTQKAGIIILSALSQTEHGVAAIEPEIPRIVGMLLPDGYLPIPPVAHDKSTSGSSPGGVQTQPDTGFPDSSDPPSEPSSWMMGPACALRILSQDEKLRNATRETVQYGSLKHLYLTGTLVDDMDTPAWRINTPNRADVLNALNKMIKAIDEEMSEEGFLSTGDAVLPHIQHWDRLRKLFTGKIVAAIAIFPALLGAILAVVVGVPVYWSAQVVTLVEKLVGDYRDSRFLAKLREVRIPEVRIPEVRIPWASRPEQGESDSGHAGSEHGGEDGSEGSSSPTGGERSQGKRLRASPVQMWRQRSAQKDDE